MLSRMCNFYPRPPRGGRPCSCRRRVPPAGISIHALREEGDAYEPFHLREKIEISIHALREEGDKGRRSRITGQKDFYPRPPRGGRLEHDLLVRIVQKFLSTPSARRAT